MTTSKTMGVRSWQLSRSLPSAYIRCASFGVLALALSLSASATDAPAVAVETASSAAQPAAVVLPVRPKAMRLTTRTKHWYEVGIASWYGSHFQGHKTATGEKFDMNLMTCAHPTLPLGTWLRVTNLKNRKTTFVRVNDRGPVPGDRIVDLSYAAAQSLGLGGLGKVRLEAVLKTDPDLARALVSQLQSPLLLLPPIR